MYLGQYRSWWQFCTLWDGNTAKCGWLGTGDGTSQWRKERADRIIPESKNSNSQGKEHCFSRVITLWSLRSIASHPAPGVCRLLFLFVFGYRWRYQQQRKHLHVGNSNTLSSWPPFINSPHIPYITQIIIIFWLAFHNLCYSGQSAGVKIQFPSIRASEISLWWEVAYLLGIST